MARLKYLCLLIFLLADLSYSFYQHYHTPLYGDLADNLHTDLHEVIGELNRFASPDGLPAETLVYYFVRNRLLFGRRFTEVPFEVLLADLDGFIASWRRRLQERKPERLGRFEELVAMAVEDARAGVMGKREGVGRG